MQRLLVLGALFALNVPVLAATQVEFAAFAIPDDGRVVVPVAEGDSLAGVAATLDERLGGALASAAAESAFRGEAGSSVTLLGVAPYARIDLVGIGPGPANRVAAENYGGTAAALLAKSEGGSVQLLWPSGTGSADATAARVAFGYRLRAYRFDRLGQQEEDARVAPVVRILSDDGSAGAYTDDLAYLYDGVAFARNMSSMPGNVIYPETFIEQVRALFRGVAGVRIEVLDEKDLARLGMGAHLGVGQGSSRPPRLLVVEYEGGGDEAPVALAGKGITFDTGGITLKDNDGMWMMKGDLGGAGVVIGTVYAAARRGAPVNVVALAALAENMPSGTAIRPGDVLTSMSGLTIEIGSTDAEGRLVLADAVHYAQENYSPAVLIDVATLTGSVGRALGDEYAGIFGRHDEVVDALLAAGEAAGESLWRLPLDASHFKQIESKFGDIVNSGVGSPGASVGAAFIGSFVSEEQPWAHLDIAGVDYMAEDRPTIPMGYSGWGVRTLDEYLRGLR